MSYLEKQLKEIEEHAATNEMKINQKKSKVMLFNTSTTNDCQPEMDLEGLRLEVVTEMKLLGVIITEDLKWHENTSYTSKKALSRLWVIRRLKKMGATVATMLDIYIKQVRSVIEYAAVVWNAGLTLDNIAQLERVQRSAFSVILGRKYTSYEEACTKLNMKTLAERRKDLSVKFAIKASKHRVHHTWFVRNTEDHMATRLKNQHSTQHVEELNNSLSQLYHTSLVY